MAFISEGFAFLLSIIDIEIGAAGGTKQTG
jgi:hypothetical protein